jgi:hypothetical protein
MNNIEQKDKCLDTLMYLGKVMNEADEHQAK